MSDTNEATVADEKSLLVLICGTLLPPTLPVTRVVVVPTSTAVVLVNTPAGANVTGAKLCEPLGVAMIGVKVVVAPPKLVYVTTALTVVPAIALAGRVTAD